MKKYFALGFGAALVLVAIGLFLASKFIKSEQEKLISTALHDENISYISTEIIPFDNLSYEFLTGADNNKLDHTKNIFFLNFWATWCAPCVQELPAINILADSHPTIEFAFCNDEEPAKTRKFLKKKNLSNLPAFGYSSENLPTYFDHSSIPCTYIIDNNAKIMYRIKGVINWNSKTIKNLLDSFKQ